MTQLLNWRKTNAVIANGNTLHFAPFNGIYVYFRYNNEGGMVMVIMNKNERDMVIDTKRFAEILTNKYKASNVMTGETTTNLSSLTVKAKTTTVLTIN